MTTNVLPRLETILKNVRLQKGNIDSNFAAASAAIIAMEPDVEAAIDLLISKVGDVNAVGKMIGAKMSLKQLDDARHEVMALEALLQVAAEDKEIRGEIVQQMSANLLHEAANS